MWQRHSLAKEETALAGTALAAGNICTFDASFTAKITSTPSGVSCAHQLIFFVYALASFAASTS